MKLTEEEKQLVLKYRKERQEKEELIEKRKNCNHKWAYACHVHNDIAYDCVLCGATKFE